MLESKIILESLNKLESLSILVFQNIIESQSILESQSIVGSQKHYLIVMLRIAGFVCCCARWLDTLESLDNEDIISSFPWTRPFLAHLCPLPPSRFPHAGLDAQQLLQDHPAPPSSNRTGSQIQSVPSFQMAALSVFSQRESKCGVFKTFFPQRILLAFCLTASTVQCTHCSAPNNYTAVHLITILQCT